MNRLANPIRLVVTKGPDAGRAAVLERPTLVIGTGSTAGFRLSDAAVESEHLQFSVHPEGVRLRDLSSSAGATVGSLRVRDALFSHSTPVTIGETTLVIEVAKSAATATAPSSASFGDAIAESAPMRQIFTTLERAAKQDITVLLCGESGVGKDVLANAIHRESDRAAGPFVTFDCSVVSPALIESQLFGHERGAFTGADQARDGAFVQADGGTLFLDEIGELPLDLQPKLLRALESREVRPVGGTSTRAVDVRVIAATNRELNTSAFRRDLYYRLAVLRVDVPALRERRDDILPLARKLIDRLSGDGRASLTPDVEARLVAHSWPGNVRELKNVIQRFVALGADARELLVDESAPAPASTSTSTHCDLAHLRYREARAVAIERFERAYVAAVLARANNVVVHAARHAGVERESFHRILGRIREASNRGLDHAAPSSRSAP